MGERRYIAPDSVRRLWDLLNQHSPTYLVGGAVRDNYLSERQPRDFDLASALIPRNVSAIVRKAGYQVIPTGEKFGTMTVLTPEPIEVTTFRSDGRYSDNRHPDQVSFSDSLEDDLARRDFTMNAMAISYDGELIDPFGGVGDTLSGRVRCVGNATDRFQEDPLRMWRGVRFTSTRDTWTLEESTIAGIYRMKALTSMISRERVRDELWKILSAPNDNGLLWAAKLGLLSLAIPEWQATVGFTQHNPHHDFTVDVHTLEVIRHLNKPHLKMSALLHDIAKPLCFVMGLDQIGHFYNHDQVGARIARDILRRLRFSNDDIERISLLVEHHMFPWEVAGKPAYRRLKNKIGCELMDDLASLHVADVRGSQFKNMSYKLSLIVSDKLRDIQFEPHTEQLAITGHDVMNLLGIPQGPEVGKVLSQCRELVIENPEKNKRDDLLKFIFPYTERG